MEDWYLVIKQQDKYYCINESLSKKVKDKKIKQIKKRNNVINAVQNNKE